jgi:protease-4
MAKDEKPKSRWGLILGILLVIFILGYIFLGMLSLLIGPGEVKQGNVAVIPIRGVILTEASGGLFESGTAVSSQIVQDIEDAAANPGIKAIVLEIDSPGGAPVATDEIATALKNSNKTTVAWIREIGTSGAYWVASSAEYIVANRMSMTGSIGVYSSYIEFSGLMRDWNVTYERLVAGKYKDMGVPYRQLTEEERGLLQKKLDLLHREFKEEVRKNRKLSINQIDAIATGEFFLGSEAKTLGLVDELGGKKEALRYVENKLGITAEPVSYEHNPGLIELLTGMMNDKSFYLGKGLASGLRENERIGMIN